MGVVYEAFDRDRRQAVALKTLREFDPASLYHFKHEFRALSEIVHPNLIPLYELVAEDEHWFFTMELVEGATDLLAFVRPDLPVEEVDSDRPTFSETSDALDDRSPPEDVASPIAPGIGIDLDGTTRAGPIDETRLRTVFLQLAEGVAALHAAGKLHRDLKPSNVLVTPAGRVVVLDFGLIAELGFERMTDLEKASHRLSGSARTAYHATDRGLTGTLAYMSPEQAARVPLTAASDWYSVGVILFQTLTGRLPFTGPGLQVLEAKQSLDAPAPSQCAAGIPRDLDELCTGLLQREPGRRPTGPDVLRILGAVDSAPLPLVSSSGADGFPFVGRTTHLAELNRAFETMLTGQAVVCHVSGRSGAGKSALIAEFVRELSAQREAVILTGRCYEQESVPYKAVDSLVDALTRHLLGLPDDYVRSIAPRFMPELGRIFPVLCRVEALTSVSGEASAASAPRDVRRHAFDALRALLTTLARRRPLVLQIDDLQWGDVDSAALLADLLRPPHAPRLLLLLAYRSEYLATSRCLQALAARDRLDAGSHLERRIVVDALSADETRTLALGLLGADRPQSPGEAEWIVNESGGSAFFVYELVEYLRSGAGVAGARPDLDQVLWERIRRLPEATRRLLEVVAVAGRPVRLEEAQTAAHLMSLGAQVIPSLRAARLVRTTGPGLQDEIETFHDRVRESIKANLRAETAKHYHAGLAASLELSGRADAETLAAHFDGSGDAARASYYYEEAAKQAIHVLAFDRAETLLSSAAALAPSAADRARVQERMIHFYTDMARFNEAYAVARTAVQAFGLHLPARFNPPLFALDFLQARARLGLRRAPQLLELPTASDERLRIAVRLTNAVAKAAYQIKPQLSIAVATKLVKLCLQHGNTPDSAIGYMVFGCIFRGGVIGNHRVGYEYGRLALDLVRKYDNDQQRAEVHFVVGYFGTSWLRPATEAEALWRIAFDAGLRTGDLFHTGCACAGTIMSQYMRGVAMDRVWQQADVFLDVLQRNRLNEPIGTLAAVRQAIRNLRGETRHVTSLDDADFDEAAFAARIAAFGSRHFAHFYFILKLQLLYLWGDYDAALAAAAASAAYLKDSPGMLHSTEHHFYLALTLSARSQSPRRVRSIQRQFRKWAAECPANFLHKSQVLEAEIARTSGHVEDAVRLFRAAEETAARFGYVNVQALAAQLAAHTLKTAGRPDDVVAPRDRAVEAYRRWGASAYADHVAHTI